MYEMNNAIGHRGFGAIGQERSIYPLRLDGVPLEASDYPRKDFGPVGSKPKSSIGMTDQAYNLMNSWVSDYCNDDGSLFSEQLRGSGAVPCLPKIPALSQFESGTGLLEKRPYYLPQQTCSSFLQPGDLFPAETSINNAFEKKAVDGNEHYRHRLSFQQPGGLFDTENDINKASTMSPEKKQISRNEHYRPSFQQFGGLLHAENNNAFSVVSSEGKPISRNEHCRPSFQHPGVSCHAETSTLNACSASFDMSSATISEDSSESLSPTSSSSGYETGSCHTSPRAGRYYASVHRDAQDFSERYGYYGRLRNFLNHRPRKGKYFIKFNNPGNQ